MHIVGIALLGFLLLGIIGAAGTQRLLGGIVIVFVVFVGGAWIFAASQAPAERARQQALYCANPYQAAVDHVVCESALKPAAVAAATAAYGSPKCVAFRRSEATRMAGMTASQLEQDFDRAFPLYPECVQNDAHVTGR